MVMPGEYSLPVGCARLRGSCIVALSDSRQLRRHHRLSDQGDHPITTWIAAHGMSSPFARVVYDLLSDHDPLTEAGSKYVVLDVHRYPPRSAPTLVDPRLRVPSSRAGPPG